MKTSSNDLPVGLVAMLSVLVTGGIAVSAASVGRASERVRGTASAEARTEPPSLTFPLAPAILRAEPPVPAPGVRERAPEPLRTAQPAAASDPLPPLPIDVARLEVPPVLEVEYGLQDEKQFWGGESVDGVRHGPWIQWDGDEVRCLKVYEQGRVVGPWVKWHPGGRMAYHVERYGAEGMEGRARYWYPDGTPQADLRYVQGQRDGECRYWKADGSQDHSESGVYEAGRRLRGLR